VKNTQTRICQIPKQKNIKIFHWDIITICNYNCEYCYSRANESQWNKITSTKTIDEVIDNLSQITHPIEVAFLGGEPSKHPKYFYILDKLNKLPNLIQFSIFTNGSISKEFISKHENTIFNVTYHASQVKDIDKFKEVCLFIKENHKITITILFDYTHYSNIIEMLEFCTKYNFMFYVNLLFEKDKYYELNEDQLLKLEYLNKTYNPPREMYYSDEGLYLNDIEVFLKDKYHFKGWTCNHNYFYIPVNESVFKRLCTEEKISIEEINNKHSIICPMDNCLCAGNLTDEKYNTTD
jgi:MoaA/NifB/PqqE/SkfB family radical SAM enzyme